MTMSWLIVMFILNGTPTITDGYPPQLVPASECMGLQQRIGLMMAQAFPETDGMVFCIRDNRTPEAPDVEA